MTFYFVHLAMTGTLSPDGVEMAFATYYRDDYILSKLSLPWQNVRPMTLSILLTSLLRTLCQELRRLHHLNCSAKTTFALWATRIIQTEPAVSYTFTTSLEQLEQGKEYNAYDIYHLRRDIATDRQQILDKMVPSSTATFHSIGQTSANRSTTALCLAARSEAEEQYFQRIHFVSGMKRTC